MEMNVNEILATKLDRHRKFAYD